MKNQKCQESPVPNSDLQAERFIPAAGNGELLFLKRTVHHVVVHAQAPVGSEGERSFN